MVNIPDPRRAFPGQVEPTLSLARPSAGVTSYRVVGREREARKPHREIHEPGFGAAKPGLKNITCSPDPKPTDVAMPPNPRSGADLRSFHDGLNSYGSASPKPCCR